MTQEERIDQFVERLKEVAAHITPQARLAAELNVPVTTMGNWLYRDRPGRFTVQALKPIVDRKWRALQKSKCLTSSSGRR